MPDTRRSMSSLQTLFADNTSGLISAQDARDLIVSVDQQNSIQSDVFANLPVANQEIGDLFLVNNGFYACRWNGSAWLPFGPIFPLTDPQLQTFSWTNQGSASVSTANGGIVLSAPGGSGSDNINIRQQAVPSTPYSITVCITPTLYPAPNNLMGLCWLDSGSGKLIIFCFQNISGVASGGIQVGISKWNSPTAYSSNYTTFVQPYFPQNQLWLKIRDDGTNRTCSFSADGVNFTILHSVGNTDFLTANQLGFMLSSYGSGGSNFLNLQSWLAGT